MDRMPRQGAFQPGVSVVMPCRNAEAWIGEAVRSALFQEQVLEVVLVDDGSTDRSVDIVKGLGDPRVRILSQAPQGASRARTAGTLAARGRYVQYLDADDVLLTGAVDARVTALERAGGDVAYSDWVRYERQADGEFQDGEIVTRQLGPRPELEVFTDAWWPPGALLYRRATVDRIGPWREDLPIIQDARFLLDAALCNSRFVHVPGVGLRYRVHGPTSLSRRDPHAFAADCFRNARDVHARWEGNGGLDPERRRALLWVYGHIARGSFVADQQLFEATLRELLRLDPVYRPEHPWTLRLASTVLGYRRAEHLAVAWRGLKRLVGR
jgi:glycosyltransferase involved in cell wall biosynthesis